MSDNLEKMKNEYIYERNPLSTKMKKNTMV